MSTQTISPEIKNKPLKTGTRIETGNSSHETPDVIYVAYKVLNDYDSFKRVQSTVLHGPFDTEDKAKKWASENLSVSHTILKALETIIIQQH